MKELVIAAGFNVNDVNEQYSSPLMGYARYYCKVDGLKIILAAGADISLMDIQDLTVIDHIDYFYSLLFIGGDTRTPKEEILKLLTEGVSDEYQSQFDRRIENIRYGLDKRNSTLFDLLLQRYEKL